MITFRRINGSGASEQFANLQGQAHEMAEDPPGQVLPLVGAQVVAVGKLQVGQGDPAVPPVQTVPEGSQAPHQPVADMRHNSPLPAVFRPLCRRWSRLHLE